MSHVHLLLNMVSAHKDDLELWAVDEIKTGTVASAHHQKKIFL